MICAPAHSLIFPTLRIFFPFFSDQNHCAVRCGEIHQPPSLFFPRAHCNCNIYEHLRFVVGKLLSQLNDLKKPREHKTPFMAVLLFRAESFSSLKAASPGRSGETQSFETTLTIRFERNVRKAAKRGSPQGLTCAQWSNIPFWY